MDTFVLILALGLIAALVLIIIIYRYTRKEVHQIENRLEAGSTQHRFEPGRAYVERQVEINAPPQHHQGARRKIAIEAAPLPDLRGVAPEKEKGIEEIITVIINPIVRFEDSRAEVYQFEPPLDVTVQYTEADVKATTLDEQGIPKLSLIVAYQASDGWKWERLKTRVNPSLPGGAGTLHAKLHTLRPKDPIAMGRP
ncbi:MAG TPA: hypothetical protein VFD70_22500 [Anaerolineae bacterium]|nr:hypothetical protein [Anaerolineae bacterium]